MVLESKMRTQGHAVMIPLSQQSHTTAMLQLAQLLIDSNVMVTFLCSDDIYNRLGKPEATPEIRFLTFPEPPEHMTPFGSPMQFVEYILSLQASAAVAIDAIVTEQQSCALPPVSAVICDGHCTRLRYTARKYGLSAIEFLVASASVPALISHTPLLFHHRLLPPPEEKDAREEFMEKPLGVIESMPWLRGKDLPSYFVDLKAPVPASEFSADALDALVINTCDTMEAFVLADLNSADKYAGKAMGIGPVPAWSCGRTPVVSSSLYSEDRRCLQWLSNHKSGTVVYASFGSTGELSAQELCALACGLRDSGHPFLWVLNQGKARKSHLHRNQHQLNASPSPLPPLVAEMLQNPMNQVWCLVDWAPQREVLGHPAIGAFVNHGGWNSILEGILAGVPMLFWCCDHSDQPTNRRLLTHVWRVALQLQPRYNSDDDDVAEAVKMVMDPCHPMACELRRNVKLTRESAMAAVAPGQSSHDAMARLLQIIRPRV